MKARIRAVRDTVLSSVFHLILRAKGVQAAYPVRVWGGFPHISNKGTIHLGPDVGFRGKIVRAGLFAKDGGVIKIGKGTFFNMGANVSASRSVEIGEDCLIGDFVAIFDSNFHAVDEGAEVAIKPVKLGRNVWLARGVIVLPGVEIGDHSVIAAGSVVTKSIPPRVMAAGNPARVIRAIEASDHYRRG